MIESPIKSFIGKARGLRLSWAGLMAAVFLAVVMPVTAHSDEVDAKSSRIGVSQPVAENGGKCVEDEDFMRRNHMELLKHHRDDTMHKGIRTTKHSLKNCIECHASKTDNSVIGTNDHFCQGCHNKAAVKLDCFECHSSKTKAKAGAAMPATKPSPHSVDKDKQSGLSGKIYLQLQNKQASLNKGEVVK